MKAILLACILFSLVEKYEMQSDLMFQRIASFAVEHKRFKEVFLSKIIEETWMASVMTCQGRI